MTRRSVLTALAVALLSVMVLSGLVLAVLFAARGGTGFGLGGRIAVLTIDGIITDDTKLLKQIRDFREDASVRGYVVAINSPGGGVGPSQSIYRELQRLREDGRPVIASIGGVGASGGYYVALGADSIFANPGSLTGSIGVIMEFPDASRLLDKVGVRMQVVKSAEHKDIGSPFRPITPGDSAILTALVQDVYQQFVEVVATERHLDRAAVQAIADGRILSGQQALNSRLIDRLGNFEDALSAAGRMAGLGDEPRMTRPPEDEFTLWDLLLGRGVEGALRQLAKPLDKAGVPDVKLMIPW